MGLCILGGSLTFSAQGGRGKEKNCKPAEKIAVGSEGEAEGGVWGREFRLARAEAKPRRPARSEQNPAKKFSFPFRRKKRGAQNDILPDASVGVSSPQF